jgi:hypothetical protein
MQKAQRMSPQIGTLGMTFLGMHYANNQRLFTCGNGGYFSPGASEIRLNSSSIFLHSPDICACRRNVPRHHCGRLQHKNGTEASWNGLRNGDFTSCHCLDRRPD